MTLLSFSKFTRFALAAGLAVFLVSGCETLPSKDYSLYRQHMPRSILVLPPLNESVDANAPYSWLTTISEPLGELGYYVFPVVVVDEFMKENGLPDPEEMHSVPLEKIDEVFGADAVLYVTLEEFGQTFELVNSVTRVKARARLVDVRTGVELWTNNVNYSEGSSGGVPGGFLENVIAAVLTQVSDSLADTAHEAARLANRELVGAVGYGLLSGPLHPEFDAGIRE